jgi:hypothetical protein
MLREHVRQQRIARDVERHAEEDVGAALIELAAQLGPPARDLRRRDMELEECVAGISAMSASAAAFHALTMMRRESGLVQLAHDLGDLVDVAAVGRRPIAIARRTPGRARRPARPIRPRS